MKLKLKPLAFINFSYYSPFFISELEDQSDCNKFNSSSIEFMINNPANQTLIYQNSTIDIRASTNESDRIPVFDDCVRKLLFSKELLMFDHN